MSNKIDEKKSTYEDGPHGGAEAPDNVTPEGGEVQKRKADTQLKTVSEAFAAIFEGVDLPEDFSTKAEGILEALIKENLDAEKDRLEEQHDARVAEIAEQLETSFTASADRYLSFVAERWMKENKLAVVSEAKVSTAVALVEGITELLSKHNVKIEESTFDKVAELESKLAESRAEVRNLSEELIEEQAKTAKLMAEMVLRDVQEGMVATDAEKLASLVEGFDTSDLTKYRVKLEAVKEANFSQLAEAAPEKKDELFEEFQAPEVKTTAVTGITDDLRRFMGR